MRRVVVTGLGLLTPLACGVEQSWQRLLAGKSGARAIDHFEVADLPGWQAPEESGAPIRAFLRRLGYEAHGWGLGAIEWLQEIDYLVLGVAIFICQIFASHLWLRYFRYGPLEWLWRWAVYARRPPFLIARDPEARR